MSSTPEQQPTDDDATTPAPVTEPVPAPGEADRDDRATPDNARTDTDSAEPTTVDAPEAPATTPGRGAHLRGRPAPVPPEPDPELDRDLPRLATPADTAPTAALPAFSALDDPLTAPTDPVTPAGGPATAVRRTSFRSDLDPNAPAAPDPFSVTPPPAPAVPSVPYGTELPGTGPSDDQVPPGDATIPAPQAATPVLPVAATNTSTTARPERRGGVGRLLAGMLVGLLAGAVGCWLVVFGQSRILGVQAPGWDASYDPLGVVLVTVGVLILATLIGVGAWSTAAPLTAGLLTTVIGVVYLYVPATTHADTVSWLATDYTRGSVERTVVAATSGTLFVVGALLLATGITLAALHRRRIPRI